LDPRPRPNPYAFVGLWELDGSFCAASLVAPDYVLTAGHCAGKARVTPNVLNRDRDLKTDVVEMRNVVEYKWQWATGSAPQNCEVRSSRSPTRRSHFLPFAA